MKSILRLLHFLWAFTFDILRWSTTEITLAELYLHRKMLSMPYSWLLCYTWFVSLFSILIHHNKFTLFLFLNVISLFLFCVFQLLFLNISLFRFIISKSLVYILSVPIYLQHCKNSTIYSSFFIWISF